MVFVSRQHARSAWGCCDHSICYAYIKAFLNACALIKKNMYFFGFLVFDISSQSEHLPKRGDVNMSLTKAEPKFQSSQVNFINVAQNQRSHIYLKRLHNLHKQPVLFILGLAEKNSPHKKPKRRSCNGAGIPHAGQTLSRCQMKTGRNHNSNVKQRAVTDRRICKGGKNIKGIITPEKHATL